MPGDLCFAVVDLNISTDGLEFFCHCDNCLLNKINGLVSSSFNTDVTHNDLSKFCFAVSWKIVSFFCSTRVDSMARFLERSF